MSCPLASVRDQDSRWFPLQWHIDKCPKALQGTPLPGQQDGKIPDGAQAGRLAFSMVIGDKSLALRVEYYFKRLAKKEKERIVKAKRLVFDKDSGRIRI
jgi:hypothetical protein